MKFLGLIKSLDDVCYRYRLRPFEPYLRERGWSTSTRFLPEGWLRRVPGFHAIKNADAVLLQRRLLPVGEVWLLRRAARRLVYDFDDAIFYHSSNAAKSPRSRRRENRFAAIVQAADAVIAGNDFLADFAARFTDPSKIRRIPTCVESGTYEPAQHSEQTDSPRLVWIGAASTLKNLDCAAAQLEAVASAVPNAQLNVICDVFPEALPIPVRRSPWSAAREAANLAEADVGISWLPDHPWSRGKCGLKVLQYMAAGLPVVANSVGVHREMVVHGRTGFLVDTPKEWAEAVRVLVKDADLRRAMGAEGRKLVALYYNPQRWGEQFVRLIEDGKSSGASGP